MRNHPVTQSRELTFHALADPTRRAVLDLLRARGRQPAGAIAASFAVSRPAISKHLRVLRQARLVHEHRQGRQRVYQLNPAPLREVDGWLEAYRGFWRNKLDQLKFFVETEQRQAAPRRAAGAAEK
jgi:DNA-binding transcriptional ArsR family regulator